MMGETHRMLRTQHQEGRITIHTQPYCASLTCCSERNSAPLPVANVHHWP